MKLRELPRGLNSYKPVCLIVLGWLLAIGELAVGQDTVDKTTPNEKVVALVGQLSKDDAEGEAAKQKLVAMGVEAIPSLDALAKTAKPEMLTRINAVRVKIEEDAALQTIKSTMVTLEGEMPLLDALDKLEQQANTAFHVDERVEGRLELSFKQVPFWQAIDEILDQSKLKLSPYGGEEGELSLVPRPADFKDFVGRTVYSKGFRICLTRIESARDFEDPSRDGINVKLSINWESRIRPIAIEQSLAEVKAVDEFKDEIPVRLPLGVEAPKISEIVQPEVPVAEIFLPFQLVNREIEKIDKLEGTLRILVPGRMRKFEFGKVANLKRSTSIRHSSAVVKFFGSQKNEDLFSLSISLEFDKESNPFEQNRGWVLDNEIYLVDGAGKKVKPIGSENAMISDNEMGLTFLFETDPKECSLVYESPARLVKVPIKYRLKKIILP